MAKPGQGKGRTGCIPDFQAHFVRVQFHRFCHVCSNCGALDMRTRALLPVNCGSLPMVALVDSLNFPFANLFPMHVFPTPLGPTKTTFAVYRRFAWSDATPSVMPHGPTRHKRREEVLARSAVQRIFAEKIGAESNFRKWLSRTHFDATKHDWQRARASIISYLMSVHCFRNNRILNEGLFSKINTTGRRTSHLRRRLR